MNWAIWKEEPAGHLHVLPCDEEGYKQAGHTIWLPCPCGAFVENSLNPEITIIGHNEIPGVAYFDVRRETMIDIEGFSAPSLERCFVWDTGGL